MSTFDPKKTLFLIDGSAFLYRAYYGLQPLHTSRGEPVQAVYSFVRMIKKLIDTFNISYVVLVWDSKGKTLRHGLYSDYKATRKEAPSDLFVQKERIITFADLIFLKQVAKTGFEADDLMYSLAKDYAQTMNVVLVTSDKDMGQTFTLGQHVFLFDSFKDTTITKEEFEKNIGFPAEKLSFYYALLGDSSDNIPGVEGIGKKGALELVQQFASLQDLYSNIDQVKKGRIKQALIAQKENAFLSERLFLLHYQALGIPLQDCLFEKQNWAHALLLFQELEFKSLEKEIKGTTGAEKTIPLSESKGYKFETITTKEALETLVHKIKEKKTLAIDTELNGLHPLQDALVGISICLEKGTAYYIPFGHENAAEQLSQDSVLNVFKSIIEDATIKKIMHHAKFDQLVFAQYGIIMQGLVFDTLVAAHLITEDWQRVGLKYLSVYYLQEPMLSYQEIVSDNGYAYFGQVPLALATEYAAADAHQTLQLVSILQKLLQDQNMHALYYQIEFPLIAILFAMEKKGILLDATILQEIDKHLIADLYFLREKIIALIGNDYKNINLNSSKQLATLLFEHLKLPPQKKSMGKTIYSTDQEVLEALSEFHPVPALIVKYRELFKLKSTYVDALPHYINAKTGRIHSTFSQTSVATGRLASSDPNLQNIPINTIHYKNLHVRSAFKPEKDYVFLSADYSQIELRVLAFFSQDSALVQSFLEGEDIHQRTAAGLFGIALNEITFEQRQVGKRINFSILYGLTPYGLSKDLKIPFKDAKMYIEKYFAQYPGVSSWMESVIKETKEQGYVTTHWGRRRYVSGIYEENRNLFELACRIAINTKAQGSAAEIMKKGMIDVEQAFHAHSLRADILLQIHDELLISVHKDDLERTEQLVKTILEKVVQWNIPLIVSTCSGNNWQEVTK